MLSLSRAGNLRGMDTNGPQDNTILGDAEGTLNTGMGQDLPKEQHRGSAPGRAGRKGEGERGHERVPSVRGHTLGPTASLQMGQPTRDEGGWGREDIPEHNLVWSETQLSWIPTVSLSL